MGRKKREAEETAEQVVAPRKVTDIEAAEQNIEDAVYMFCERWLPLDAPIMPFEVMDQGQLRDAMGLRATIDIGDPWPKAENILLSQGWQWHLLGNQRVMYMREKSYCIPSDNTVIAEELIAPPYGKEPVVR